MSSSFGGTVKLTGESEYRKALKDITNNLKVMSSEIKLTASEFSKSDDAVENSKNKSKNLNKQIDQQVQTILGLQEGLKLARKEYGDNSREVANWQSKLNLAKADLNKLNSELEENEKSLNDTEDNFDDAGNSALKFGDILKANVLGNVITGGLKKLASAVKEVGSTIINVGKESLNSYADYEQLVGGVKKLFGEDMSTVMNNANSAFASAGMNANEYMETVTSFSASLISSLNGDTAESARIADTAIKDMADNANTFGTDMSMIQNAYQGFAKQNYTMLDNLKLGYGGTKEEMQRLLAEAEKMPEAMGQKFDISNYADVVKAINIVQQNMGITGTTANEANQTISGSISSMSSAWQNMLTGIATGNTENMRNLVNNLANSVITAAQNILPRVQEIASGIVSVLPQIIEQINENLPMLLNSGVQILNTLIEGIMANLPAIMQGANQIISTLLTTLIEMLPQLIEMGIQIIVSLTQGLVEQLPTLIPQMIDTVVLIVDSLLDNIDLIIDAGIQLIIGLAEGLINALPQLIDKIPVIIEKLINAITNNLPKLTEMGITLIVKLGVGLIKAIPQLISKIPQIISSLVNGFKNYFSNMGEVGKNLVSGIWEGIKNAKDWLLGKVKEWCGSVLDGIKGFFGIHSPSKVFRDEIGTNLALGLGEGFSSTMKDVSQEMANSIPTEFDINSDLNTTNNSNSLTLENLTGAFIKGVKNLNAQIIIDKDVAGRFIITSVNSRLGEVM